MKWFRQFEWKRFGRKLYEKVFATDVFGRSAQVGFYFSFAFFPLLLFLVTLFGIVLGSTTTLQAELYQYLGRILPPDAFKLVRTTMGEIIETSTGAKLTLGLFITLWSASSGVDSLRNSLNSVYELDESRPWWFTKLQSVIVTFLFIVLIGVALGALAAGWQMFERGLVIIGYEVTSGWLLSIIQWSALALLMIFSTAVVYNWLPSFKKFHWVWITPGALVSIIFWAILTSAFRLYLQYFNSYNKAYGSLGAVIILMLWMYLTAMAILVGGAINSVISEMSESPDDRKARIHEKEHLIRELKKQQSEDRQNQ